LVHGGGRSQTEVQALVGAGGVAASAEDVEALAHASGGEVGGRSDGVARALGTAHQPERDPVVRVLGLVAQEHGWAFQVVDDHVDLAAIEEVAEGGAAAGDGLGQAAAGGGRHYVEVRAVAVVEEQHTLRPGGPPVGLVHSPVDVAVDGKQ